MGRGKRGKVGLRSLVRSTPGARELCVEIAVDERVREITDDNRVAAARFLELVDGAHPLPDGAPPFRILFTEGMTGFSNPRTPDELFELNVSVRSGRRLDLDLLRCFAGYIAWHVSEGGLDVGDRAEIFRAMRQSRGFQEYHNRESWREEAGHLIDMFQCAYAQWVVAQAGGPGSRIRAAWDAHRAQWHDAWDWDDFAGLERAFDDFFALKRLALTVLIEPQPRARPSALAEQHA